MSTNTCNNIVIYSQNVSCDIHSQKLVNIEKFGNKYSFRQRIGTLVNGLPNLFIDVIAFNEIRKQDNLQEVVRLLEEKEYSVKTYANNKDDMSFNNVLAVSVKSQWIIEKSFGRWVAHANGKPCLLPEFTLVEGDKYGRCAGVIYLKHKENQQKVCVVVSHVLPFGEVKVHQQDALFSINQDNLKGTPIPTIIVGDLNRFTEEEESFQERLNQFGLIEAKPTKLIIPKQNSDDIVLTDDENVGTFSPWPTDDKIYKTKLAQPMCESRLDVQLCTRDASMIMCSNIEARASMMCSPNESQPPEGVNHTRHILDCNMASDHIALIGTYSVSHPSMKAHAKGRLKQVKDLTWAYVGQYLPV